MELDQILFKKAAKFYQRWKHKKTEAENSRIVYLENISSRLTIIARALTGKNVDIMPAEKEGGSKRNVFYLPVSFSLLPTFEENLNFYLFRTVYLSIQMELKWKEKENDTSISTENMRKSAEKKSQHILQIMSQEYPVLAEYHNYLYTYFEENQLSSYWLYGKYMPMQDVFDRETLSDADHHSSKQQNAKQADTEIQARPVEEVEIISVDKKSQEDYVMTHNFEKVETAEEFRGIWRGFDGEDSLEEDADALNELNLRHLVRTDEEVHSIYQADFRDLRNIAESAETDDEGEALLYNEWDYSKKKYKLDYCKVYVKNKQDGDMKYAKNCLSENIKTLNALRRKFAQIHQKRQMVKRLPDGEQLDIDALVGWISDLKSGKTPSDHIYKSKRKKEPDLAVLFLLDLSLSTDSYADGNRVLDVEKQAVILFGQVLEEYQVDFAIGGFYSKTRNNCAFHILKGFGESWTKGVQKLGAVQAAGYTRIGPALRHAQSMIEGQEAAQKWVILLSDGKPNDYDKYEGKYGIADVKQALREMHEHHIQTYAIAIESRARYYLPQMFGQNHYNILSHPEMLIPSLTVLYRRINNY